jgi:hypothetical protein
MHDNAIRQRPFICYPYPITWLVFKSLEYFGSGFKTATYVSYVFQVSVRMQAFLYASSPIDKQTIYIEKL